MTATQHVVVDGSNIATEGRSTPSLDQLEGAVAELRKEMPGVEVTVVVDATFAHRIDPAELPRFEAAALRGEFVSPPAGAIGRGDAFLLRIAQKVEAVVLSNDSFQEFHGEHDWLFERGRLLGATPVPGIGWIFVPRTPVRGPKSRVATRDAKRARERVEKAIAAATKEAVEPEEATAAPAGRTRRSRSRGAAGSPQAVNDPTTFIGFIAEHRLGEEIEAEVESFSSHGAIARYGEVRCYLPLGGLGDPPPRSVREVLHKGERHAFVITALDPYRRGVELALPGVGVVSGRPSEETVAAEVRMARAKHQGLALPAHPKVGDSFPGPLPAASKPAKAAGEKRVARSTKAAAPKRAAKALAAEPAAAPARPARAARSTRAAASEEATKATKATKAAKAPAAKKATRRTAAAAPLQQQAPGAEAPAKKATRAAKAPAAKKSSGAAAKPGAAPARAAKAAKATTTAPKKAAKAQAPRSGAKAPAAKSAGSDPAAPVEAAPREGTGSPRRSARARGSRG